MMIYPELLLTLAYDRQHELIAEAARARILKSARRSVHTRRINRTSIQARTVPSPAVPAIPATAATPATPATAATPVVRAAAVVGPRRHGGGSVTPCVPRAAAPAGR